MGSSRQRRARVIILSAIAGQAGLCAVALADSGTWTGTTTGSWSDPARWTGAIIANGVDSTATFGVDVPTSDLLVRLDASRTIGNMIFTDSGTGTAGSWVLDNNGSATNVLTLETTAGVPTITVNAVNAARNVNISLTLAGTQGLTKAGTGTLLLSGTNTYTGTTTVSAGTLQASKTAALPGFASLGAVSVASGGTMAVNIGGAGQWTEADIATLLANATFVAGSSLGIDTANAGGSYTYASNIGGAQGLTKLGAGNLTLTGANTYAGTTTVSLGTLTIPAGVSFSGAGFNTVNGNTGARLIIDGGSITASATSTINNNGASGGLLLNSGSATFTTLQTSAAADGALILVNGGTLTANLFNIQRSNNTGNSDTAPTAGQTTSGLYVNGASAVVNFGDFRISTSNAGATARIDAGTMTVSNAVVIGGQNNTGAVRWGILDVNGGSLTVNGAGGITIGADSADHAERAILLVRNGVATTEKISFGDLDTLTGGRGVLTVNGGTLYVGSGGIVKAGGAGYSTFINLTSGTLGAKGDWSTSLPVTLNGGAFNVLAADASNVAHNITIDGAVSGAGSLVKAGGGTLYLNGSNSYTGGTTVQAGAVVGSTSAIRGDIANAGSVTFAEPNNVTYTNAISGTGSLTKTGTGTIIFTGSQAYTGATTISEGGLRLRGVNGSSAVTVAGSARLETSGGGVSVNSVTFGSAPSDAMTLNLNDGSGISALTVTGANGLTAHGTTTIGIGVAGITHLGLYTLIDYNGSIGGAGFGGFALGALPPRVTASLFNNVGNTSVDLNVTAIDFPVWSGAVSSAWNIGGAMNWKTAGNGTPTTYLQNNIPGDTVLFNDSATGTTTVDIEVTVQPTFVSVENGQKDYTFTGAGKISGPTGLTKSGTGTLTIANSGGNDYTGATTINGGTVALGADNVLPDGSAVTVSALGTLNVGGRSDTTGLLTLDGGAIAGGGSLSAPAFAIRSGSIATNLAGTAALTKSTPGTASIATPVSYSGGTNVNDGTLRLDTANGLPTYGTVNVGSGATSGTLDLNGGNLAIGRLVSGGTGTANSVRNSMTGVLVTLTLNGGDPFIPTGSSSFGGTIDGDLAIQFSSQGTLTLGSTASTFTGGTVLDFGGTVVIAGDGSLGAVPTSPTTNLSFALLPGTLRADAGATNISLHANRTIHNEGTLTVDTNGGANTMTINGVIDGGFLTKAGNGTLILTNAANNFGDATVSAGNLRITNSTALGTGTVTVGTASLQLGNGVNLNKSFVSTSTSAENQINVPEDGATATYSGNATAPGAQIRMAATGAGATLLFTGTASLSNVVVFNQGNIVFQNTGSLTSTGTGAQALIGRPAGGTQTIAITVKDTASINFGGLANIGNARGISAATLTVQDSGAWTSAGTFNLLDTTATTATSTINLNGGTFTSGAFLKTSNGASQTATINFNGGTFRPSASSTDHLPALANTTAKVQNGGAIIDTSGFDIAIHLPLIADTGSTGGVTKNGAGVLTLASVDVGGPLTITSGRVNLSGAGSRFKALSYAGGTKLDAGTSRLVITGSTDAAVVAALLAGYNGGAWDGDGIVSSAAAAEVNDITGIGWAHASALGVSSWDGLTGVNGTDILTKYTYVGDLTLDGRVGPDDYVRLDRGRAMGLTGWINGDVNYSGGVDVADYFLVDKSYGLQTGILSPALLAQREAEFGAGYVAALTAAVPEPSALAVCGLALPLLGRRRGARS